VIAAEEDEDDADGWREEQEPVFGENVWVE
jgi:hypothetical protein